MNTTCRCGLTFDAQGRCDHCDTPGRCRTACARCHQRDAHCYVCGTNSGTPVASAYHEKQCRTAEREAGR